MKRDTDSRPALARTQKQVVSRQPDRAVSCEFRLVNRRPEESAIDREIPASGMVRPWSAALPEQQRLGGVSKSSRKPAMRTNPTKTSAVIWTIGIDIG